MVSWNEMRDCPDCDAKVEVVVVQLAQSKTEVCVFKPCVCGASTGYLTKYYNGKVPATKRYRVEKSYIKLGLKDRGNREGGVLKK